MFEKYDQNRQTYYETFIAAWQQSHSIVEVESRLKAKYEDEDEKEWFRTKWKNHAGPHHHSGHSYPDPKDRRCKKHHTVIEHTRLFLIKEGIELKEIPSRNNINWEALHSVARNTPTCVCER